MQHAPINDPARYRLQKLGMGNAPEVVREVRVYDFRVAAKQQLFHLDHRLLGVSPGTVGIEFRWKVGFEGTSTTMTGLGTSIAPGGSRSPQ